jgi:hypothetical protein
MCDACREAEKLASNITPEVEQVLERLATFTASKVQEALGKEIAGGLPRPLAEVVAGAAIVSLAEAYTKGLAPERVQLISKIAVRIVDTSEKLKAEHARGPAGLLDAMRRAGIAVEALPVGPAKSPERH